MGIDVSQPIAASAPVRRAPARRCAPDEPAPAVLLASATGALWFGCLIVGVVGLLLPYPQEHLPAEPPPPVILEAVRVELAGAPPLPPSEKSRRETDTPAPVPPPAAPAAQPPPPPDAEMPPAAPALAQVAVPNPAVAFAVPVEGPVHVVDAKRAAPAATPATRSSPAAAAAVRRLTFGVGEGQQPSPQYPRDAVLAREQGTVVVRFKVAEDGTVVSAEATTPCRWPLLNQAAVRAVHEHWRFGPGPARTFDVAIEFQLNER